MKTIYAIDFDGTLCEKDKYPSIGEPNLLLIEYVKKLKEAGNTIILWTCRCEEQLDAAVEWCKSYGLEFDYVNENAPELIKSFGRDNRKIFANYYIDDRAFDFKLLMEFLKLEKELSNVNAGGEQIE